MGTSRKKSNHVKKLQKFGKDAAAAAHASVVNALAAGGHDAAVVAATLGEGLKATHVRSHYDRHAEEWKYSESRPDYAIRLRAAELWLNIHGAMAPKELNVSTPGKPPTEKMLKAIREAFI